MDTPKPPIAPIPVARKILVLDDDAYRRDAFAKHYAAIEKNGLRKYEVHFAKNYREFVEEMKAHAPFYFVSLDHDLGDFNPMCKYDGDPLNPPEFTGAHAARYIAELPLDKRPTAITLHSHSPFGAMNMQTILQQAFISSTIRPFDPHRLQIP